jgi:hypothetical protein
LERNTGESRGTLKAYATNVTYFLLNSQRMLYYVGFEVFTAVVLKSIFFWDMTPCSEDGGDKFLRNVGYHSTHYTASYPRRRYSSMLH